jgi:cytochrome o ubiquinol oxidase subunit III
MLESPLVNSAQEAEERRSDRERGFGLWLYLMSDAIIFALLFATYLIMVDSTAAGPSGRELFHLGPAFLETILLLMSSATFGVASAESSLGRPRRVLLFLALTFALGLAFLVMEISEFKHLLAIDAAPDRSGFLSAYFTLVGMHGLHVAVGMLWILVFGAKILLWGLNSHAKARLSRLALFWHFLDVIWVGIFSIVYLQGIY